MPTLSTHLRSRISKVCVALTGATAAEMLDKAAAAAKENPFLEFRLDSLDKPATAVPKFRQFLAQHTEVTAIATCRREENGGQFTGTLAAQLDILLAATTPAAPGDTQSAFELFDLEVESAEALKPAQLAKLRETGAAFLCSWHDFHPTPDLDAVYARMLPFAPDIVKIVPTATSLADNLTLLRFIERLSDTTNVVGIAMGEAGSLSRVLGLRAGSTFTFAAANAGEETGPGQIAARTLVEMYRIDAVDASTKVYGVVGNPVSKSLSPVMMNSAFRRETVNALYLALPTHDIKDLIAVIPQIPLHGLSITMPHKQAILPYLEHMDPLSAKIGAVNTVSRVGGNLYGFNTDVAGILAPLEKRLPVKDAKILVLGAGGSARAAVFALRDKGADVTILNRTPEAAVALAQASGAHTIDRAALFGKQAKSTFDVILNTTPIGMSGNPAPQLLDAADLATLNPKIVFDIVYNPLETPLLALARRQSIPIITGVEMFVQQGMRQFEIWTGKPAPEEEMLRVVLHALKQ